MYWNGEEMMMSPEPCEGPGGIFGLRVSSNAVHVPNSLTGRTRAQGRPFILL